MKPRTRSVARTVFVPLALASVMGSTAAPPAQPAAPAVGSPAAEALPRLSLQRLFPKLELRRPVQVVFEPGNDARLYILEQPGRILAVKPDAGEAETAQTVLDIRERVNSRGNEEGLLALAFHPKFAQNRQAFLYYTAMGEDRKRVSRLSRFLFDPAAGTLAPGSEEVILQVDQPYSNHNGGTVLFGPDGMLYLSLGDGGAANDPLHAGQDLGTLLAKVLRLDVDRTEGDRRYAIPADNPFVAVSGARPEVWAYGLRNIWRMSFDRKTGELYGGDVGQNSYEEVDIIRKGGNYGWNVREGLHAFPGGEPGKFGSEYVDPIVEYPRSDGISITGGYVYRGTRWPELEGVYLYADLATCRIWGIRAKEGALVAGPRMVGQTRGHLPTSFGEANDGTLYLVTFEGNQDAKAKGGVWRIGVAK